MQVEKIVKPVCDGFIGWLGGKTRLRPTIINSMPKHFCYVEVFCGSGTVFFGKPPEWSKSEIINDVHCELVNLMKVLSGTYFDDTVRQEFVNYVRNMPAARDAFEEWKHWNETKLNSLSPAARAFRFYYCVKKGFSSTPTGGYESSPFSTNRYNMESDFDRITARFRARNAQIERLDFRDLVEKYSNSRANTFFFMDPPYVVANDTNYYEHAFSNEHHDALRKCCDKITANKDKFLITYDDVQEIIDLYKGYNIYRTDPITYKAMPMEVESDKVKTEIFISNYEIESVVRKKLSKDIFDEVDHSDKRIDFADCIGLIRIQ